MNRSTAFDAMRSLKNSWELAMRAPGAIWGAGLILFLVDSCTSSYRVDTQELARFQSFATESGFEPVDWAVSTLGVVGLAGTGIVFALLFGALLAWLKTGYFNGIKALMKEGTAGFGDMFDARANWLNTIMTLIFKGVLMLATGILMSLAFVIPYVLLHADEFHSPILFAGLLVTIPAAIYVSLGLTFMVHAAAIDGLGPVQSLSRSWSLADGQRWSLIVFHLVQAVLAIIGLLAICIGIIPAAILIQVMWVEAYVQATDTGGGHARVPRPPQGEAPHASSTPPPSPPQSSTGPTDGFDPSAWRKDLE